MVDELARYFSMKEATLCYCMISAIINIIKEIICNKNKIHIKHLRDIQDFFENPYKLTFKLII